jgi:hypothetical protein
MSKQEQINEISKDVQNLQSALIRAYATVSNLTKRLEALEQVATMQTPWEPTEEEDYWAAYPRGKNRADYYTRRDDIYDEQPWDFGNCSPNKAAVQYTAEKARKYIGGVK